MLLRLWQEDTGPQHDVEEGAVDRDGLLRPFTEVPAPQGALAGLVLGGAFVDVPCRVRPVQRPIEN